MLETTNYDIPKYEHRVKYDESGLHQFLVKNRDEILALTEKKTVDLAGFRPSSDQLKEGLPIFYEQLLAILLAEKKIPSESEDKEAMAKAASESDEPALAKASGHDDEEEVAKAASRHGVELLRLGYTLSHVVHAYGAMCQSITELATINKLDISPNEFHDLNRCLDIAIAGAVTGYELNRNIQENTREVEHLGFLAHELRNALTSVNISVQLIKRGTVGISGSTGLVMEKGLKRIEELIDRSLTEVRLRVDPSVQTKSGFLLQLVDQIILTAEIEAHSKQQTFDIQIDPSLVIMADQQLIFSAISNLILNAIKFTHLKGRISVRGKEVGDKIVVEVEDECGGLSETSVDLFKAFTQENKDKQGLGLGLTIAKRAVELNQGTLEVENLPGRGCIFRITMPKMNTTMKGSHTH